MSPRKRRFRLLLDEMFSRRGNYPLLNGFHDLKHIVHDFKLAGASDKRVIKVAYKQDRILVTKNIGHFRKLSKEYKVDILGIKEVMIPEEIDNMIMAKLRKWKNRRMCGRFIVISKVSRKNR